MNSSTATISLLPFPVKMKHFIDAVTAEVIKDTEFRPFDIPFITVIGRYDGISQKDISAILDYDKSYTTRIINHLIDIKAVENRATGKTHSLHLTEKGNDALNLSLEVADVIENTIFGDFNNEERAQFISYINRIGGHINDWMEKIGH